MRAVHGEDLPRLYAELTSALIMNSVRCFDLTHLGPRAVTAILYMPPGAPRDDRRADAESDANPLKAAEEPSHLRSIGPEACDKDY